MGRELRRVPITNTLADHPRRTMTWGGKEALQPMYDEVFDDAMGEWIAGRDAWKRQEWHLVNAYCLDAKPGEAGYYEEVAALYDTETYEDYVGGPPDPAYYRPPHPEGVELGIQLWESTSEGTPISEVYPDTERGLRDLCEFAAENCSTFGRFKATADEWFQMLSDGLVSATDPDMPGVVFL